MLCHVFVILIFNLNEQVTRKVTTVKLTWHRQYNADKPKLLPEKIHIVQFNIEILPVFPVCIILDSGLKTQMTFEMTFLNNFYIILHYFFFHFLVLFFSWRYDDSQLLSFWKLLAFTVISNFTVWWVCAVHRLCPLFLNFNCNFFNDSKKWNR